MTIFLSTEFECFNDYKSHNIDCGFFLKIYDSINTISKRLVLKNNILYKFTETL